MSMSLGPWAIADRTSSCGSEFNSIRRSVVTGLERNRLVTGST